MTRSIFVLTSCVLLTIVAGYSGVRSTGSSALAVLKVYSAEAGEEVRFEGRYFNTGSGGLQEAVEARETPFEVSIESEDFVALFRSLEEGADIRLVVEVHGGGGSTTAESIGSVALIMRHGAKLTSSGL